jgi:hypothetical protein
MRRTYFRHLPPLYFTPHGSQIRFLHFTALLTVLAPDYTRRA